MGNKPSSFEGHSADSRQRQFITVTPKSYAESLDIQPHGLKVLYKPEDAIVDILFVHGLTGHRENTWTAHGSEFSWPQKLLPLRLPHARIMTFGYDSRFVNWRSVVSQNRIGNHAKNLLHAICHYRDEDGTSTRAILLVAHSLGGLVCEDALLSSRNSVEGPLRLFVNSVHGVVFMGTPHSGAALAKWAEVIAKSLGLFKQTSRKIVEVLNVESEVLGRIQTDFHTMLRDLAQKGHQIHITCFYEELPLPGIGTVVPMCSAILNAYPHIGIHANHMAMARFSSDKDPGFISVVGELQRWIKSLDLLRNSRTNTKQAFIVPYERHLNLIGRETILDELDRLFTTARTVGLAGIGGVGKSEIAIEYCYRFKERNPTGCVFWVSADTSAKFEEGYRNMARRLQLPGVDEANFDVLRVVAEYLSGDHTGPWALVLDNADDLEMFTKREESADRPPLATFLPKSPQGSILITSRDAHVGFAMIGNHPVYVSPLSKEHASILLYGAISSSKATNEKQIDYKVIEDIVSILDNLPLAITQASAYINRNQISAAQYLEELTESDAGLQALLSENQYDLRRGLDSINSVVRTWKLSFDRIEMKNVSAARLLCVMSHFNRQSIPRELLRGCSESQQRLTSDLGILQAFSLIQVDKDTCLYSMHRLVQFVTCVWQKLQGTKKYYEKIAISLISAVFPLPENENISLWQLLLPHAYVMCNYQFDNEDSLEQLATLLHNVSWYELQQSRYKKAKDSCSTAVEILTGLLGLDHLKTLKAVGLMGMIFKLEGNYVKGIAIQKDVLWRKEAMLGPRHLETMQTLSDLTDLLIRQGSYLEAEECARKVLEVRRAELGIHHPKSISMHSTLSHILASQGRHEEAESIAWELYNISKHQFGAEHNRTLISMTLLCFILDCLGQYGRAIELCSQIVNIRERTLGYEHIRTLSSINNLARLQHRMGHYQVAEKLYRDIIPILERTLGLEYPETMASFSNLAVVLRDQKKFDESELLSRQVLERRGRICGKDNPRTLLTLNEHAILLDMQGKLEEAEVAARYVLKCRKATLGERNPETLITLRTLGSILWHQGDLLAARETYQWSLSHMLEVQSESHPDTITCMFELGCVLEQLFGSEKAYKYLYEAWQRSSTALGDGHPLTVARLEKVGSLKANLKKST